MELYITESYLDEFISKNGGIVQGDEVKSKLHTVVNFLTKDKKLVPTSDKQQRQSTQPNDWFLTYTNYNIKESKNDLNEDVFDIKQNNKKLEKSDTDIENIDTVEELYYDKGIQPLIDTTKQVVNLINNLYENFDSNDDNTIRASLLNYILENVNFEVLSSEQLNILKNKL